MPGAKAGGCLYSNLIPRPINRFCRDLFEGDQGKAVTGSENAQKATDKADTLAKQPGIAAAQ
jgi:hypothetical protein